MSKLSQWWVERNDPTLAEHQWDAWQDSHRFTLPLALTTLGGVESIYELGCGSGPNLRLLRKWNPDLRLGGSEPCTGLAAWASEHLGIHIDQTALPEVPQEHWDVVVSCYTLAYLEPEEVLTAFRALDARAMVLLEPMGAVLGEGHGLGTMHTLNGEQVGIAEWHHDYMTLLNDSGWRMTWRWPLIPRVHGLNAVLIAER